MNTTRLPRSEGAHPQAPHRSSYWIFGPSHDLLFVLLTPLLILPAFMAAQRGGWTDGLVAFALVLAMGHYLPGILRAYGDRALFQRFRIRLIVSPLFFITIAAWFAYLNLNFVFLLTGLWGAWHWTMQIYGFSRIYDAKANPPSRTPARLDQILCILWFGACVFVLNDALPLFVARFYKSGGAPLPAEPFVWFTRAWLALTAAVTLLYAIHALRKIFAGQLPNPLKFVFIAATFIYLAYTASQLERPLVAYAMFESWHDIQYLSLVWFFNLSRGLKNPDAGRFTHYLFRPRPILVLAYVAACLAFGSLTHAWKLFEQPIIVRMVASFVPAMAFLHYYLDGFIWKIRETATRQALLGTEGGADLGENAAKDRPAFGLPALLWNRHALLWLLFVTPATLLLVLELKGNIVPPLQVYENLVATFPQSSDAHYELGRELLDAGRLREAKVEFEDSLSLAPNLYRAHNSLGVLLADEDDLAGAGAHFERALMIDPRNADAHNNLGLVLARQGDLTSAQVQVKLALDINPLYAAAHNNLGMILAGLGDLAHARIEQERATQIAPDFVDAHYELGVTMAKLGDADSAALQFEQALRVNPNQVLALNDLGVVLARKNKLSEARELFERALRIKPDYLSAQRNLEKANAELESFAQSNAPAPDR